ncbi:fibronectin type III domain-containing protein [Raineya orbicola]|uniref:Por secretion system C-terminal sorting domain n=1 Tax=Raineya orbicola TaxID=2016530 RepID=A0A2N3IG46_9BACT|nr:fibronectin type III domain-containing protein [Raineya orbicola]PKQ69290.1 Por secretion system C-terminal sorting domain [Raineya orbicola]
MKKLLLAVCFWALGIGAFAQMLVVDFNMSSTSICVGQSVTFTDASTAISTPAINSWSWNFDFGVLGGASPSTASTQGPHTVTFNNSGVYIIRLEVSNGILTNSTTKVLNVSVGINPPIMIDFEGTFPPAGFSVSNSGGTANWEQNNSVGYGGGKSMWRNLCSSSIGSNALFFNTPRVNLVGYLSAFVEFKVAYQAWSASSYATLALEVSTNCGVTYTSIWSKSGEPLATVTPWFSSTCFTPTSTSQWRTEFIDVSTYIGNPSVQFRLRLTDIFSNHIYIDDFKILTVSTPPNAPTGLTANAPVFNQVNLSWTDNATNEWGYRVERSPDGSTWTQVGGNLPPSTTSYTDNTVAPNTLYYYRVYAYIASLNSYSNIVNVTTPNVSLNAPSALTATAVSATRINLAWTDNDANEAGYKVERSTDGITFTEIASSLPPNTTSFSDNGLTPDTEYWYRVRCFLGPTNSSYSNVANARTFVVLNAPTTLTATAASTTQINLTWVDNATNETGYKVERSTDGINFTEIASSLPANSTSYASNGLTPGTLYFFRVRAFNGSVNSPYSNTASAAPLVLINAPTSLVATAVSPTQINLAWVDNATNEAGYKVERSTDGTNFTEISGTGLAPNSTTFIDAPVSSNTTYYYRVRAFNGPNIHSPYSNVAQATTPLPTALENEWQTHIKVYPNPAENIIWIDFDKLSQMPHKVSLYNTLGILQDEKAVGYQRKISFEVSKLPKGVYHLQIIGENARIHKKLVVK